MKKILIATTNPGKLAEIKFFLKDLAFEFVSLKDLSIKDNVVENGKNFEENAKIKARFYSEISGLPTIADDGGLEIEYLHGEPGVKSRRWINNKEAGDQELVDYTLKKLEGVPKHKRGAKLVVCLALALPSKKIFVSRGEIKGVITEKPFHILTPGFPFRSLLYIPKIGKYYHHENLTKEENLKYNHRGKALRKLKTIITEKLK